MAKKVKLVKDRVIMRHPIGKKPTRFRFKDKLRLGFKGKEVVEIVKFKKTKLL